MLSAGRWSSSSRLFQALNIVGALLLCASATASQAWPAAAVNAIWIVIGLQACVMMLRSSRSASAQEPADERHEADVFAFPERTPQPGLAPTLVMPIITQEQLDQAALDRSMDRMAS